MNIETIEIFFVFHTLKLAYKIPESCKHVPFYVYRFKFVLKFIREINRTISVFLNELKTEVMQYA